LNVETNLRDLKTLEDGDAEPLFDLYGEVRARYARLEGSLTGALAQIARRTGEA